jgi:LysR family transcriptional activator of dmlA
MSQTLDLSFFYLLANKGSLAATARELGVTPPAVSKRLSALEARLGIRLVNRTACGVLLWRAHAEHQGAWSRFKHIDHLEEQE